jgi:hypothetical protein
VERGAPTAHQVLGGMVNAEQHTVACVRGVRGRGAGHTWGMVGLGCGGMKMCGLVVMLHCTACVHGASAQHTGGSEQDCSVCERARWGRVTLWGGGVGGGEDVWVGSDAAMHRSCMTHPHSANLALNRSLSMHCKPVACSAASEGMFVAGWDQPTQ